MNSKVYTLLLVSSCNFSCSFCATKNLKIKSYNHISDNLKQYFINNKISKLVITGGEPLTASITYLKEIIKLMEDINKNNNFEININSNLVLWEKEPEKYDEIFNNKHVEVDTSFQYGGERKDLKEYSEERFINLFNKFYDRYKYRLIFNYVVNKNNEKYIIKACELAKKLNTKIALSPQLPVGISKELYLQPDILLACAKVIEAGYEDQLVNINWIKNNQCFFGANKNCKIGGNTIYIDINGNIIERHCYPMILLDSPINITKDVLFHKCYACKLKDLCNNCSILRYLTQPFKEEHCKKMKENLNYFIKLKIVTC